MTQTALRVVVSELLKESGMGCLSALDLSSLRAGAVSPLHTRDA